MATSADEQARAGGQARSRLFVDQAQLAVFPMIVAEVTAAIIDYVGQSESKERWHVLARQVQEFARALREFHTSSEPARIEILYTFCLSQVDALYAELESLTGQPYETAKKQSRGVLQKILDQAQGAAIVAIPHTPGLGGCSV